MRTGAKSTLGPKPRDMKLKVSTKIKGNQGQLDTCLGREWQWSISTNWKVRVPHTKNEIKQSKRQSRTGFAISIRRQMELVFVEIKIILKFTITQSNSISPNQQMKQKCDI